MVLAVALAGCTPSAPPAGQGSLPRIVDVPTRPAFVRLPGRTETDARIGQNLLPDTVLRTQKPGRLQVELADGRRFRLGGDALLRLASSGLDLQRGQIIAWVNPGSGGGAPLRVKTRVGTASIVGTTVFLEVSAAAVKVFSWEGDVQVRTETGERFALRSGEQLTWLASADSQGPQGWQGPRRLSQAELRTRRAQSILLNGFTAPMETLPVLERELGLQR